jgi:hypothetical protein
MKKILCVVALTVALGGCMTTEERIAAQGARDNQKCLSYGAQPGSPAYVTCRSQLDAARTTAEAIEDAAPPPSPNPIPATPQATITPMPIPQTPYCRLHGC